MRCFCVVGFMLKMKLIGLFVSIVWVLFWLSVVKLCGLLRLDVILVRNLL